VSEPAGLIHNSSVSGKCSIAEDTFWRRVNAPCLERRILMRLSPSETRISRDFRREKRSETGSVSCLSVKIGVNETPNTKNTREFTTIEEAFENEDGQKLERSFLCRRPIHFILIISQEKLVKRNKSPSSLDRNYIFFNEAFISQSNYRFIVCTTEHL
jgi:hypothetical protein